MTDVNVVYISGAPRSGTTLLGMALGQLPGVCDVGELWALWRPAFRNGDLCGCGRPVPACPFWLAVAGQALGPDFVDKGAELGQLHRRTMGTMAAPRAWLHLRGTRHRPDYDRYAEALGRHYRAIAEVGQARVVVDSSKMASDALLAESVPHIELKVIHIVRDPRGVVWSWRKQARMPGPDGRDLDRHSTLAAAARWDTYNAFAEFFLATRLGDRYRMVRYEDLMAHPGQVLGQLARWIGADPADLTVSDNPPRLSVHRPTHPVWGNPIRTSTGAIALVPDEAWRDQLPRLPRLVTTMTTLPLLARYHYPLRARAAGGRTR